MARSTPDMSKSYEWSKAKSLMPRRAEYDKGPTGALVPDGDGDTDHIAVVYDKGEAPPEITINHVSGTVHTVLANGIAVAVVARASGKAPSASDILLVERSVHS
ncbi:hypothetical protein OS189_07505 [Sulfitobacter sp. F26169L]|uniref:hypothetical protein n=1 Tax=Sulfitobacter sp. F26169L TaxID=2996015 RepID=UPI002260AFC7|nr:hypothetical protein [Sulfitobacter sp. F26169L]MCX7566184.1 hypothetical protein [Sulfitobacter sp. F26169L]